MVVRNLYNLGYTYELHLLGWQFLGRFICWTWSEKWWLPGWPSFILAEIISKQWPTISSLVRLARHYAIFSLINCGTSFIGYINGLVRNSSVLAMELRLFCIKPSIFIYLICESYTQELYLLCSNISMYSLHIHIPCGGYFMRYCCLLWVCLLYWFQQYWCPVLADLSDPWLHSDSLLTPGDHSRRIWNKILFMPKPKFHMYHIGWWF